MKDIEQLSAEVERLRTEGLRSFEGWEEEKQESHRLRAAEIRFKNLTSDLREELQQMTVKRDTERERAQLAEEAVQILKARVDELIASFETYGDHQKSCQKRSFANKLRKKEAICSCGFESIIAGGGSLQSESATDMQSSRGGQ